MADGNKQHGTGSTTSTGAPAPSDRQSLTVGPDGPIVLHDVHFLEQMAHFNREKVPERQPHAKGAGAFGVFETTEDVSAYTKAALFRKGAATEMLARFSTVAGEAGSPDTWRDVRGFSLKFYTDEGNYDLVGNNTPIFFVRDPMKFPHFIRSQKRLPDSGLRDKVDHHYWSTFGAAGAVGLISGLAQYLGTAGLSRGDGDRTVIIAGGASDATAQASWTLPSVVSLLTGRYVTSMRKKIPEGEVALAEVFRDAGYFTVGIVANGLLVGPGRFDRGFDRFHHVDAEAEGQGAREDRLAEAVWTVLRKELA